ncbi:autotransporter-associated beta strand repeat-containing protein, partial [Phyllobacterium myrsinacearum]|uniref:autotransporter-associated beta strand repeat-containing protein n=1 Tax=Phyllobacterium myrsinacearum TaxID=28101 RepID=UPI001FEF7947
MNYSLQALRCSTALSRVVLKGSAISLGFCIFACTASFAQQYWDGSNTTGNQTVEGGTGQWDGTTTNWTDSAGAVNTNWNPASPGNNAVFGGTAGIVTVVGQQRTSTIDFNTAGYVINGGTLNLAGSPDKIINVAAGTATIGSTIIGNDGFSKGGVGTLILTGNNTYTGGTLVENGTLQLGNDPNRDYGSTGVITGTV